MSHEEYGGIFVQLVRGSDPPLLRLVCVDCKTELLEFKPGSRSLMRLADWADKHTCPA